MGAPKLTHLFLADDFYLFIKVTRRECKVVKGALNDYRTSLSLDINLHKFLILLSKNVELS